jgi:hypothetical protein
MSEDTTRPNPALALPPTPDPAPASIDDRRAVDEAEIERRIAFADAALGAAGHEVTDPKAREVARQIAVGRLTANEAVAHHIAGLKAR